MSKWTLSGWRPFTAPAFAGSPSEMQLFREVACVPLVVRSGQSFGAISFSYRTERGPGAAPPPGSVVRLWLANEYGEVIARFQPVPIISSVEPMVVAMPGGEKFTPNPTAANPITVVIPFQFPWNPEPGAYHALISCSIPSGEAFTGLILRSCYGLVPPVDGVASLPGQTPTLVGQRRFEPGSNPAVDDLGQQWPEFETWLETHQLPLITFEEA